MRKQGWRIGMNAVNFIKEHSVERAREVVRGAPDLAEYYSTIDSKYYHIEINAVNLKQLKNLVDSVDFINNFGGIDLAKAYDKQLSDHGFDTFFDKAISNYESIYSQNDTALGELK